MASLCTVVILGGKNPLVVLLTSNCADAAGVVVPMPTCACIAVVVNSKKESKKYFINIVVGVFVLFMVEFYLMLLCGSAQISLALRALISTINP
jgi:hypothetical protein